jgi:glycosyltransferase involved in cell wall biosynthesis
VVIGRNEGARLRRCLESLVGRVETVVYVDSGSTDDSVVLARELGATVVALDTSVPFTAARARNTGFETLDRAAPGLTYVQFVDGDCEVVQGWLEAAHAFLDAHREVSVVCGRRRERFPEASVYNELCDIEWDTPVGEARACGGDAMMLVPAFKGVGGFNPRMIAGEEPELCVRLRAQGGSIVRLEHEMTLHDAAMTRFSQWWKRSLRAGYAYGLGKALHGAPPEKHSVAEVRRILFWGALIPVLIVALLPASHGSSLLLLGGYGVSAYRVYAATLRRGKARRSAARYAVFCTLGKFPELIGLLRFQRDHLFGRGGQLIEYK